MNELQEHLKELGACDEAIEWAGGYETLEAAWADCDRSHWMLWYAGRVAGPPGSTSRRPLTLACCECARLELAGVPTGEERPQNALDLAEAWARGEDGVTLEDVEQAAKGAFNAAGYAADALYGETLRECADIVRKHYAVPPTPAKQEEDANGPDA